VNERHVLGIESALESDSKVLPAEFRLGFGERALLEQLLRLRNSLG
jgi:hypothetical protein